ncbi:MAG: hypothetical protein L3J79_08430 [Candidatus Marinimicrobia bacterium]|nr:hypothetical protein [Candidatus Neomarinimicrobiota bacterium]
MGTKKQRILVFVLVSLAVLAALSFLVVFLARTHQVAEFSKKVLYGEVVIDVRQVESVEIELIKFRPEDPEGAIFRFDKKDDVLAILKNVIRGRGASSVIRIPNYYVRISMIDGRRARYVAYYDEVFRETRIQVSTRPVASLSLGPEGVRWLLENCPEE